MAGILMGVETEYAVVGTSVRGERIEPDVLTERLMDQAVACLPHLPARSEPGIFLPNGGRLYIDTGAHIEFSTPECGSPEDVVRAIDAGDRILLALAAGLVERAADIADVAVYRHNVDYLSRTSWGCHESYLHTAASDTPDGLVVRVVFVCPPDSEAAVRGSVVGALRAGRQAGPDGAVTTWQLVDERPSPLTQDEHELAERLARSAR